MEEVTKICLKCSKSKPLSDFRKLHGEGLARNCEYCRGHARRSMQKISKAERTRRHKEWRYSNGRTKEFMDDYNMRYHSGVTKEQFVDLAIQQEHKCAICKKEPTEGFDRLCVDHDHQTMQVRGLLCSKCNTGLGLFCDDPRLLTQAVEYLAKGKESTFICKPIKQD